MLRKIIYYWNLLSGLGAEHLSGSASKRVVLVNRVCIVLALISIAFIVPWTFERNLFMVASNVLLVLVYAFLIYLNKKRLYDVPKVFLILCVSTPVFMASGMLGDTSHLHFSLIPVAGFSVLLFDRTEKLKIILAILYPTVLIAVLIAFDFKLFPNLIGEKIKMLPVYENVVNFGVIFSTMFYFYRAYIKAEDNYQVLYEEHIKAQKHLDEERAKAIHSTKMAALGEMAGGIAHEINNPLFVISSISSSLSTNIQRKSISEEKILEYTKTIQDTCKKIAGIVRALSSISRSSHNDPLQTTDLSSVIKDTLVMCHHRFYLKGIIIEVAVDENLPKVQCRPGEIGQVLINLLSNSYDAVSGIENPRVTIKAKQENELVLLSVEDNGHGIPETIKEKIFETFYTTKEIGKGTGLGLSISKKLMEANQGRLYFESVAGSTRFILELRSA